MGSKVFLFCKRSWTPTVLRYWICFDDYGDQHLGLRGLDEYKKYIYYLFDIKNMIVHRVVISEASSL